MKRLLGKVSGQRRHVADSSETVQFMAFEAARRALLDASLDARDVDLVVLANWTERIFLPELAPQVAYQLGARNALAFDLCGACAGFVHSVQTAAAFLSSPGPWRSAVVVCTEQFSRRIDPTSRIAPILGDAAGAVVLSCAADNAVSQLIDSELTSAGNKWQVCTAPAPNGWLEVRPDLRDHAIAGQVRVAQLLLRRNQLKIDDVDWVVPHPGTSTVHAAVQHQLGVKRAQFVTNFPMRGNTASASIPIALSEYRENGTFHRGDLILSVAVGAGWYDGGLLFRL